MSPAGGNQPGLGGSGGGNGIGRGDGPGSGLNGTGSGAGKEGAGHGIDPNARGGISPQGGPGGAGTGANGQPAIPGVSVQGGNTVTLPSFGSGGSDPNPAGHSGMNGKGHGAFDLVIACILDTTGILKHLRVLEGGTSDMTPKVMAALPSWKFRPAFRGNTPVEVNAILGFNINTD
jgi:hypothetical protein